MNRFAASFVAAIFIMSAFCLSGCKTLGEEVKNVQKDCKYQTDRAYPSELQEDIEEQGKL